MFGKSVGVRIRGSKHARRVYRHGKWRLACWFEVIEQSLHPTKGWQFIRRTIKPVAEDIWRKSPATEERFDRGFRQPKGSHLRLHIGRSSSVRKLQRYLNNGDIPPPPPPTEIEMRRHAWYRRQKEREARIAAKEAWNQ